MNAVRIAEEEAAPLRVLMTADAAPGVWTYTMALARALEPAEILLAAMGPALSRAQREEADALGHVQVLEKPFALEWMADPWGDVARAGDWLLELEARFAPSVVHLNHYCYGSLPWDAPVLIAAHGCVLSWWQAVHGEGSPQSWTRYHAEVAAGLRGANMVTASTQACLDRLTRLYAPIPRLFHAQCAPHFPRFRVVPHGADPRRFRPLPKRPFVLGAGNGGDGACDGETLDAAAANLPWPVLWAPDGEGTCAFAHLQRWDGKSDLADLYGQAAVFALPSRYEPYGFAPLHAALAGCALVLGDIPSLRETWGDAALYVPPGDAHALEAAVRALMNEAPLREELAAHAHALAVEWSPRRMGAEMRACYGEIRAPHAVGVEEARVG